MFRAVRNIATPLIAAMTLLVALPATGATLQWYGQSAFKIVTDEGKLILIDPFISGNPKTPEPLKDLKLIGKVDLILVTHGHGDHVGDTVALAEMTGATVAMNADMGSTFQQLGLLPKEQLIRFNKSGPIRPLGDNVVITMTRAEHSSGVTHKDPVSGATSQHPGGEPSGYIVELVKEGVTLYHAGDTGVFADMKFIGEYYQPDIALLPIGGHFTMDPVHAAYAVNNLLKTPAVIPMHYGTFPPLKGTPEQFIEALGATDSKVMVLEPGDTIDLKGM